MTEPRQLTPGVKDTVITGAGSGIGQHCAQELAQQGWRVFALDLSLEALEATRAALSAEAQANFLPIRCDVSRSSDVAEAFEAIRSSTDAIDALICSAGILRPGQIGEMDEADFDALFAVNTKGTWLCARAAIPLLEKRAATHGPTRIIVMGSVAAIRPKVNGGAYAASKIAVTYLAKVLSAEIASKNILVNTIAPATVDTPMTQALRGRAGYKLSGQSPLGRVAVPADVTGLVQFLLSPAADYVSGAVIPVDGATSAAYIPG